MDHKADAEIEIRCRYAERDAEGKLNEGPVARVGHGRALRLKVHHTNKSIGNTVLRAVRIGDAHDELGRAVLAALKKAKPVPFPNGGALDDLTKQKKHPDWYRAKLVEEDSYVELAGVKRKFEDTLWQVPTVEDGALACQVWQVSVSWMLVTGHAKCVEVMLCTLSVWT